MPSHVRIAQTPNGISVSATDATIEQVLFAISHELGIRVFTREANTTRVTLEINEAPLSAVLNRFLPEPGFLLIYNEPWPGNLAKSPNRLWLLGGEATESRQELSIRTEPTEPAVDDPIAIIDEAIINAGDNEEAAFSALATIALSHADETTREEAAYFIGESGHPDRFQILFQTLADRSADVRFAAVSGLGSRDAAALAGLRLAATDEDPGVQEEALLLLKELGCYPTVSKELSSNPLHC